MTQYQYNNSDLDHPVELTDREEYLVKKSKVFCIYPWIHLHAYPDGQVKPCCMAEHNGVPPVGDCNTTSLREIWNSPGMREIRTNMLSERPSADCQRCYEKEQSGARSGRQSANKRHGHQVKRVAETQENGHLDRFEMTYWDIRFSNLCNLKCRSCGPQFSSQWHQDQVQLYGESYAKNNRAFLYVGRHETDIWEQLIEHIDYVEQIYFAGGEPLIMDEHYRILEELQRREMFHVRLLYNTNFTQVKLKNRFVFDYWRQFEHVSVGASLDAMGPRAEYIRKGTKWADIEQNRQHMLEICPDVDFFISPTTSILNAWHVPDFHRDWVERGLIRAQDLNINLLLNPRWLRIDIAPVAYKQVLKEKFEQHLEWLRPRDHLSRASRGFESAITFMMATDNSSAIPEFWDRNQKLDRVRGEDLLSVLPELKALE